MLKRNRTRTLLQRAMDEVYRRPSILDKDFVPKWLKPIQFYRPFSRNAQQRRNDKRQLRSMRIKPRIVMICDESLAVPPDIFTDMRSASYAAEKGQAR